MLVCSRKGDMLTQHTSYDCEYFSATKWRTIDGVGFQEYLMQSIRHLAKVRDLIDCHTRSTHTSVLSRRWVA